MDIMDIAFIWKRIEAWYEENTPPQTLRLASGATEAEIVAFEIEIGALLPEDIRSSFALHNGSDDTFLLDYGPLLSLEEIKRQRRQYLQWQEQGIWGAGEPWVPTSAEGPIKPVWWNALRLPLTDNSGAHLMADFDPAEGGRYGQIIDHQRAMGPTSVIAPSFEGWLSAIAQELENGEHIYDEDEATVVPLDEGSTTLGLRAGDVAVLHVYSPIPPERTSVLVEVVERLGGDSYHVSLRLAPPPGVEMEGSTSFSFSVAASLLTRPETD